MSDEYLYPKVNEVKSIMEHVTPFDRFVLDEIEPCSTHVDNGFDYSNQLEFHEQEVADAPKRGMPEAQVNYHLGRIALIKKDFMPATPAETPRPSAPSGGPSPEQHQLDCTKNDSGECGCKK